MYTLYGFLFSISRILCGKLTKEIIDKLEIVIKIHYRVGEIYDTKTVNVHDIEDYVSN